jgi:hypothetical protein
VQAFSTGLLSAFGHSPKFALRDMQGTVQFTVGEGNIENPHLHLQFTAGSLEVIDDISDKDRREIHRQMYEEVLEIDRFPEIVYDCSRMTINGGGNQFSALLTGNLNLHGETHPLAVSARVILAEDTLKASGDFTVSQRQFAIAPVTVAGGAIKLKDEVKCTFNITARKQL